MLSENSETLGFTEPQTLGKGPDHSQESNRNEITEPRQRENA